MLTTRSVHLKVLRTYPKLTRTSCPPEQLSRTFHTNRCLYDTSHKFNDDGDLGTRSKPKLTEGRTINEDFEQISKEFKVVNDDDGFDDEDDEMCPEKLMSDEMIYPEKTVQAWMTDMSGKKLQLIDLDPTIFGLAPRVDMLYPVVLRQLKYKIQSDPWGSEYDLFADRFAEKLYKNRPELKPWLSEGIVWKQQQYSKPTDVMWDSTSHNPIPYYRGNIPWKLRMSGLRALLSLKMRYDKLIIVDQIEMPEMRPTHNHLRVSSSEDTPEAEDIFSPVSSGSHGAATAAMQTSKQGGSAALRALLDERGLTSTLMITGKRIVPVVQRDSWRRQPIFPNPNPDVQKVYEAAKNTHACELREKEGLDVWSALLYDTLLLDRAAVEALQGEIRDSLRPSAIPNMSLVRSLSDTATEGALFKLPLRVKDVQVINIDNV